MRVVDAMNVIGAVPDGWWRDRPGALARLVDAIAAWAESESTAEWIVVVADGGPTNRTRSGTQGAVELRFAIDVGYSGPDAADHAIVDLVAEDEDPASIIVVTSDRGLTDRVEQLGAQVEGSRRFRSRLAPAPE